MDATGTTKRRCWNFTEVDNLKWNAKRDTAVLLMVLAHIETGSCFVKDSTKRGFDVNLAMVKPVWCKMRN